MSVVIPDIFTGIHDEETAVEATVNEQTIKKIIRNSNFLGDLVPIGTIQMVNINQVGVAPLSPNVWQLCDGNEIVHPDSPLRTIGFNQNFTPNIDEKYVRNAPAVTGNSVGGSWTFALGHNHGGLTGARDPAVVVNYDNWTDDSANSAGLPHQHSIHTALGTDITIDYPQWFKVAAYLKIQ